VSTISGMDADTARCVADHLAILTDQLSEVQAELNADESGPRDHLGEALQTLWKLRWELGLIGGKVVSDFDADDEKPEAAQ